MISSILVVLSTLEIASASVNPHLGKNDPPIRPVQPDIADLSGYYTCKGEEAGGKKYSGVCVLTKKNDVYVISWVVGGGASFTGIGIRQGNNLAASWAIPGDKGIVRGVNLYRVEGTVNSPRLIGRWTSLPGPGVQQHETLTFLKKLDREEDD